MGFPTPSFWKGSTALARLLLFVAAILVNYTAWAGEEDNPYATVQGGYSPASGVGAAATGFSPAPASVGSGVSLAEAAHAGGGMDYPQRPGTTSPYLRTETLAGIGERLHESSWYTREEYFHWNERFGGEDFVNEYGLMLTLGYVKRIGQERFRAELFGGTLDYVGGAQFNDGSTEPLWSKTGYLGVRGEYELLFEPDWLPRTSLLLGVGTRFWFRDLRDGVTPSGYDVTGYQETWWTIYPYLGVETRRSLQSGPELYSSARIGCTAITYEHVSWYDAVLYPKCGITGQAEVGLRGDHFFCAVFSEAMTWGESDVARGLLQPTSSFVTVGLKAGLSF